MVSKGLIRTDSSHAVSMLRLVSRGDGWVLAVRASSRLSPGHSQGFSGCATFVDWANVVSLREREEMSGQT